MPISSEHDKESGNVYTDPELAAIVEAWQTLPQPVRDTIIGIIGICT
jgi:hypothetical protein